MNSFLRSMNPHLKNVTPTYNTQTSPVLPNGNPNLNRQPSAKFGNLVDPHLKITDRILAKFHNSLNS